MLVTSSSVILLELHTWILYPPGHTSFEEYNTNHCVILNHPEKKETMWWLLGILEVYIDSEDE